MTTPPPRQHHDITLAVLATSALAYAVIQTIVAPALPEIQRELDLSPSQGTWVLTIFLVTASVATPILGRLGDMYGKERLLLVTLGVFAAGLTIAGLSRSFAPLLAGRAIQGVGGAIFPLAFGIIRDEFPRERVATAIGLISATFGIGGAAGVMLSGVIVDHLPYEWIFWLALVVVVSAAALTWRYVPESPVRAPARIDWGGAALLSVGLSMLLLGVSEGNHWGWGSERIAGLFGAGAAVLALWIWFETRVDQPLVDMRMMRKRTVWTTNVVAFLVGFGMFGSFVLTPQLVQTPVASGYGFGASVTGAGLFMLPSTAVMLIAGPASGWIGSRFGSRLPILIGSACAVCGFAWIAFVHSEPWQVYLGSGIFGLGIGFSFAAMANLIVEAVDQTQTGVATGMNTIMRSLGASFGGQCAASVIAGQIAVGSSFPAEVGYTIAFSLSAIALALAFCVGLAIPRSRRPAESLAVAA